MQQTCRIGAAEVCGSRMGGSAQITWFCFRAAAMQ